MNIKVSEDQRNIEIIDLRNDENIYIIRRSEMCEVYGGHLSKWIIHLMSKTWMPNDSLYELALIIKNNCPDIINWYETFFIVEKREYLLKMKTLDVFVPKENSSLDQYFAGIKFAQMENNSESNSIVEQVVKHKLNQYNLT